jgi:hypothetical protein
MQIKLSPQRRNESLTVIKQGDALTINGTAYDLTGVPDGASLPASATDCKFLMGDIERIAGVLHLTLLLPHGENPSHEVCFPAVIADPADGEIALPKTVEPVPDVYVPSESVVIESDPSAGYKFGDLTPPEPTEQEPGEAA